MANLYFSRDTKVYLEYLHPLTGATTARWEIPVLDGFSFSQATNASEITLNEMTDANGKSRRSRQMFNDSYAPAEWSFATYMRPFAASNGEANGWEDTGSENRQHAVEEALWAFFASNPTFTASSGSTESAWSKGIDNTVTNMIIDFKDSEVAALGTFNLYFEMGGASGANQTIYKIEGCCVNEASIDFDIDGIATINWSGFGKLISEAAALPTPSTIISEAISDTDNFIRNRLTSLTLTSSAGAPYDATYSVVLTGGNITLTNNMTFLTPETLGVVNQPLGHVTGTRSVSGNFTCYLNASGASSAELFEDIIEDTDSITNSFDLSFSIGGSDAPKVVFDLNNCHLEVPTHSIDDIISLETNFHALPASLDPGSTAANYEAVITYSGT